MSFLIFRKCELEPMKSRPTIQNFLLQNNWKPRDRDHVLFWCCQLNSRVLNITTEIRCLVNNKSVVIMAAIYGVHQVVISNSNEVNTITDAP